MARFYARHGSGGSRLPALAVDGVWKTILVVEELATWESTNGSAHG